MASSDFNGLQWTGHRQSYQVHVPGTCHAGHMKKIGGRRAVASYESFD